MKRLSKWFSSGSNNVACLSCKALNSNEALFILALYIAFISQLPFNVGLTVFHVRSYSCTRGFFLRRLVENEIDQLPQDTLSGVLRSQWYRTGLETNGTGARTSPESWSCFTNISPHSSRRPQSWYVQSCWKGLKALNISLPNAQSIDRIASVAYRTMMTLKIINVTQCQAKKAPVLSSLRHVQQVAMSLLTVISCTRYLTVEK